MDSHEPAGASRRHEGDDPDDRADGLIHALTQRHDRRSVRDAADLDRFDPLVVRAELEVVIVEAPLVVRHLGGEQREVTHQLGYVTGQLSELGLVGLAVHGAVADQLLDLGAERLDLTAVPLQATLVTRDVRDEPFGSTQLAVELRQSAVQADDLVLRLQQAVRTLLG